MNQKIERIKELVHSIDELEKELEALLDSEGIPVYKTGPRKKRGPKLAKALMSSQEAMIGVESTPQKKSGRGRPVGWKKGMPYSAFSKPDVTPKGAKHVNWYCEECAHEFNAGPDIEEIPCPACESKNTLKSKYQDFE